MPRRSARLMQNDQDVMEQLGSIFDSGEVSEQELQLFLNFIRRSKEQNVEFNVNYEAEADAEDDEADTEDEESDDEEEDDPNDEDYYPNDEDYCPNDEDHFPEEDTQEFAAGEAATEDDSDDDDETLDEDYEPEDDDSYVPSPEEDEEEYQSIIFVPEYHNRFQTRIQSRVTNHRYPTRSKGRLH
jgi:hypothetical protein